MEFELFPKLSFHFEVFFTIVTGAGAGAEIIGVLGDVWVGVVAISFATLVSISLASVIDIDKEEETAGAVERLDPFELEVTEDIAKLTGNIDPGVGPPAAAKARTLVLTLAGDYRSKKEIAFLLIPAIARKVCELAMRIPC